MPQSIHQFAEKIALVTDGETAIGRAVALQLALQGSFVIVGLSGMNSQNAAAIQSLRELGTLANAVETDLGTESGAKHLVDEVSKLFGRLDLLINSGSYKSNGESVADSEYLTVVNKNITANYCVTKAAIELMKERPKPKIVNIISLLDTPETAGDVLFAGLQAAVKGMTKSLAASLPSKFRVNCIAVSEKNDQQMTSDSELFRPKLNLSPDDAARSVLYLLSSEAIGVNGQIIEIK